MKKRWIALALCLVLCLQMVPVGAMAEAITLETPVCDQGCNTDQISGHTDSCAVKVYYKALFMDHTAVELYAVWSQLPADAQDYILNIVAWNDQTKRTELVSYIDGTATPPTTEPDEITSAEDEVNGHTIVASGCLGDNAELIAEPGDPEKNAYLNQDLHSDLNVYAYNIDLIGEFTGSVELSIAGIPVAGSNELIEVLHLLDSAEAIEAAKEKGTAQAYASTGLSAIFPEEVAASGEADTIYYEVLSASRDAAGNVVFTTDSFSEFIIYTVDFHYKGINFSIPGGTGILLSELLARLEIDKNVADVTDVTFTNYELVSVSRENGDWRLTSLQPFTSTELLVLTFSDGEVYEINVTDEQRAATASRFMVQFNSSFQYLADLTDNPEIYHNDYTYTDYIYVSPGMQFDVWRDTLPLPGIGVKYADTNIWWRFERQENVSAVVDGKSIPLTYLIEEWFGDFQYSYGGPNSGVLRKATVNVSNSANIGDRSTLLVCNGDPGVFLGVVLTSDYRGAKTGDPNRLHIYVAKQIQVTYNLNYDGNGGGGIHGTQTGYSTGTANTSMKLNRMAAPTAPVGYTFGGWNTEADGSGNTYNAGTTFQPTSNTVYYAKWIPIPYSVSFNGNGATSGSMVNQSFTFDEVKALSANQFKREYTVTFDANGGSVSATTATAAATFNGWEDRGSIVYNGKTYSYNGSESDRTRFDAPYYVQPFANPPKSKDVYDDAGCGNGHYNKYGLVGHFVNHGIKEYYTDGSVGRKPAPTSGETPGLYPDRATVSHLTTTKDYTVPLYANWTLGSVTLPEPKWDGHKFLGWYSGDDYVGDSGDTYTPAANVTLTAKWETDTYTVTYNANGGSGAPDDQIKTHGVDLTLSSTEPTRTGHTFEGWNTKADGNGTAYAPGAAYKANENLTLYAQWSQNLTLTNGYDGYLYRNDAGAASYRWTRRQGSYNVDQTDWSDTWEAVDPDAISGNKVDVYADGGYVHESGNYHTGTKWEYKVEALDSEGKVIGEATYVVNFGDQILNGSFENPGVTPNSQSGFANDHENLFWRSSVENQYADGNPWDVELVYTNNTYNFGHKIAAHMDQFAEINANTEAALYQDVLTTPGENLTWSLSHTARILGDMTNATDTMYVLIASSQTAHLITTQEQLDVLIQAAEASTADGALNGEVDLTASGVTYRIWKLTSDFIDQETWTVYAGQYSVPAGQKMTRFFFAAGETASGNGSNGNLIDNVSFDRDVHYVINYYVNGEHMVSMTESGTGLPGATVSPGKINDLTKDNYASLIGVYLNNDKVDGTDLLLSNERANVLDLYFLTNHTVTYQYTGTVPSDATALPEPETYRYGDTVTVAGAASAQGYTFSGWSRTGSFTISGDVTITGSFNAKNDGWYVVHYYRSGTTTSVCDSKKVEGLTYGSIHTEEAPTVTGYTVSGEARKTVTALYGNNEIIFYYTPNAYTVTYDGNGVEGPAGSQYDITQQITLAGVLSQNGYNFKGWMVKESVGNWTKGTVYAAGTTIEAGKYGDVTLVAQWEKITYTVTYDENGGNYVADATYTVTDSFNLAKPTRDGYDFLGWKLASNTGSWSAGTYTAGQTIGTGNYGNVTLVAQWQRQTGSLTITKSGEDVAEDQTFIFKIKGEGIEMEVVIQGANSVTIQGLPTGSYTVTEDTTWSWRYTPDAGTSIQTSSVTDGEIVSLTFHNTKTNSNWFNAMAWIKNFFGMPAE